MAAEISVIVVTYCQEDTVARTLDSILAQRLDCRMEILVSDDCSPDATAEVARRYAERYPEVVKLHVNDRNLGVQANYFGSMRRAEAELIADCAGDDYWTDPMKLQRQLDIMRAHPEVTMVHTGFEFEYPDGCRRLFCPGTPRPEIEAGVGALRNILAGADQPYVHLCTALYRKAPVLKALDDRPDLFLRQEYKCEDLQVESAAAAGGKIAYIPASTLAYSVGHESISSEDNFAKNFEFYFATTKLRLELIRHYGLTGRDVDAAMAFHIDYLMSQAFHDGNRKNAERLREWSAAKHLALPLKGKIYNHLLRLGLSRPFSALIRRL